MLGASQAAWAQVGQSAPCAAAQVPVLAGAGRCRAGAMLAGKGHRATRSPSWSTFSIGEDSSHPGFASLAAPVLGLALACAWVLLGIWPGATAAEATEGAPGCAHASAAKRWRRGRPWAEQVCGVLAGNDDIRRERMAKWGRESQRKGRLPSASAAALPVLRCAVIGHGLAVV